MCSYSCLDLFDGPNANRRRTVTGYMLRKGADVTDIQFPSGTPQPYTLKQINELLQDGFAITAIYFREDS